MLHKLMLVYKRKRKNPIACGKQNEKIPFKNKAHNISVLIS